MLTLTSLTMWLRWEQAGSDGMLTLTSDNLASLEAVECSLSPLTIWLRWEQAGSGGMLALTSDNLASLGAIC
jgi:hypothetical protein